MTIETVPDPLEGAITFVLQSSRRLYDAERVEAMVGRLRAPQSVMDAAQRATFAIALTVDEAAHELAEQIRDEIKKAAMQAVAAMPVQDAA